MTDKERDEVLAWLVQANLELLHRSYKWSQDMARRGVLPKAVGPPPIPIHIESPIGGSK